MFGESLSTSSSPWSRHLSSACTTPPSDPSPSLAPEVDTAGNLEYKLKILPASMERFHRLVTQLKWRLLEGGGTAVYELGVLDDGALVGLDPGAAKDSVKFLARMAADVAANVVVSRVILLKDDGPVTLAQDQAEQTLQLNNDNNLFSVNIVEHDQEEAESISEDEEEEEGFAFSFDLDQPEPAKNPRRRRRRRNTRSLRLLLAEREGAGLPIPTSPIPRFGTPKKHLAIAISNNYKSVMKELVLTPERTEPYGTTKVLVEAVITSVEGEGFVDYVAGVTV